jgi:hypothetical protein
MSTIATKAQTADRDRRVLLSAIGQCLKDRYPLATPVPPQLAALVKQLEAQT